MDYGQKCDKSIRELFTVKSVKIQYMRIKLN